MHPVLSALLPVVFLTVLGLAAGRLRWIRPESSRDLANLVFFVLSPALLFTVLAEADTSEAA